MVRHRFVLTVLLAKMEQQTGPDPMRVTWFLWVSAVPCDVCGGAGAVCGGSVLPPLSGDPQGVVTAALPWLGGGKPPFVSAAFSFPFPLPLPLSSVPHTYACVYVCACTVSEHRVRNVPLLVRRIPHRCQTGCVCGVFVAFRRSETQRFHTLCPLVVYTVSAVWWLPRVGNSARSPAGCCCGGL